jgi:hypothetical protein
VGSISEKMAIGILWLQRWFNAAIPDWQGYQLFFLFSIKCKVTVVFVSQQSKKTDAAS